MAFNLFGTQEEENKDPFSTTSQSVFSTGESSSLGASLFGAGNSMVFQEDTAPEHERHFMDRLFAPLEAPQQALFAATVNIADGFEINDITKALSHGFTYGNPWSNKERVEAGEILDIFAPDNDDWSKIGRGSANLALSLLYDPLLVTGVGNLGKVTKLDNVLGAAKNAAVRMGKPVTDTKWGTAVMQGLFNKNYGIPQSFLDEVGSLTQNVNKWRFQANSIFKQAKGLGGKPVMDLMSEVLEDESVYLARQAGKAGKNISTKSYTEFQSQLSKMGVDEGLFWNVYDRTRTLDDAIGEGLVKSGVIGGEAFNDMRGKHLRRMYQAFDNPKQHLKRLEDIATEGGERFSIKSFKESLGRYKADFKFTPTATSDGVQGVLNFGEKVDGDALRVQRYFTDATGQSGFNSANFAEDLEAFTRKNPKATISEILDHANQDMLAGVSVPAGINESIAKHVTNATTDLKQTANSFIEVLEQRSFGTGFNWKSLQERVEVVAKRKDLPPEIREVLGEITEFGPRIADQASQSGRLLETRKFFDNLAGVKRSPDGEILEQIGSEFVTKTRGGANTQKLTGTRFGTLEGMYTTPSIAQYLNRMEGVGRQATSESEKIANNIITGVQKVNQEFKKNKIVLDPIAQARNAISDLIMMDATGVNVWNPTSWTKATRELQNFSDTGTLGKYLDIMEQSGLDLFQSTMSTSELKNVATGLAPIKNSGDGVKWLEKTFSGLHDAYKSTVVDPAVGFMETREMLFKANAFIQHYDKLATGFVKAGNKLTDAEKVRLGRQATLATEKAMFNYTELPFVWDFARRYGVIPFVSFPVKAIPSVFDIAVNRPHKMLAYPRTVEVLNQELGGDSESVAREIAALPDYARDKMVLRLPFEDDNGRPLYFDSSYLLPWYVLKDVKEAVGADKSGGIINRSGMATPPMLNEIISFVANKDSFGQEVFTEGMTSADKAGVFMRKWYQFFMPGFAPGGQRVHSMGKTLLSHAANDPERSNWEKAVTAGTGIYGGAVFTDFASNTKAGEVRQNQGQVNIDGSTRPFAAFTAAAVSTGGGVIASDKAQQSRVESGKSYYNRANLQAEINKIRRNTRMSARDKTVRIRELLSKLQQDQAEVGQNLQNMNQ